MPAPPGVSSFSFSSPSDPIVAVRHGVPLGSYSLSTFPRSPTTLEGWRAPSTLTAVEGVVGGQIWRGDGDAWEGHGRRGAGGDHGAVVALVEIMGRQRRGERRIIKAMTGRRPFVGGVAWL